MKHIRCFFSVLCIITMLFTCTSCQRKEAAPEVSAEQQAFDQYLDQLFRDLAGSDTLTLNYSIKDPSRYSIEKPAPTLGQYTLTAMKDAHKKEASYLKCLSNFNYELLTSDQKLCYDMIKQCFSLNVEYQKYALYDEILGPTTGIQAQLPILLAEYNFSSKEDIEDYLALLMDVPRYFKQIADFEVLKSQSGLFMSDHVATEIIKQCSAFIEHPDENYLIEYFNARIEPLDYLTAKEKKEFQTLNQLYIQTYVIPAYRNLIDVLTSLLGTGTNDSGLAAYKNGRSYYEYLVQSKTGSSHTIPELIALLDSSLSTSLLDLASLIQNDPALYDKIKDYHYIKEVPEEILSYLKKEISTDFPDLPPVNCEIKYVHESLQDYLSPAMYLTPQLDYFDENSIYINTSPNYDLSELFPTIAHEGYPGHLYQNVYFRSQNNHPIRSMLTNLGYEEGWATYAESYSYCYAGLDPAVMGVLRDNMTATHCIYSRADIGIHYEGWSRDEACGYLSKYMSKDSSAIVYQTLLEEPAIYLPYCVGYLEINELKSTAKKALGAKYKEKEFHTFLLDRGPLTFSILKDELSDWISASK